MSDAMEVQRGTDSAVALDLRSRLVFVDHERAQHVIASSILGERYDVDDFDDGAAALAAIRASPPEAVLSEVDLPGLSGSDLVRILKRDPVLRRIPVILVCEREDAAVQSLDAGADDFLSKPFRPKEVWARVSAAVRSHRMYKDLEAQHAELTWVHSLLSSNEARTRAIFETAHEAILLVSLQEHVEEVNPSGERMFGYADGEFQGLLLDLVATSARQDVAADLAAALSGRDPAPREVIAVRRGGQPFPAEWRVARIDTPAGPSLCAFVRDLTEATRLELELRQAQKLEAVGRLAAGIAHEINTPIQFIGDNTRFFAEAFEILAGQLDRQRGALTDHAPSTLAALDRVAEETDLAYVLEQVPGTIDRTLEGVRRVATIVRAMKEFAHPDQKEMVETDLNRALQATLEVARNEYKYVADVETELAELPMVLCHAGDVNQVFLNLLVNAAHAIADVTKGTAERGRITIRTRCAGDAVEVAISDTGGGIPEEIRDKVYDPFFTTKEVGRGTGQGLAISRSVVEKHRGTLSFETASGRGTTFFVRLPVDGPQPSAQPRQR